MISPYKGSDVLPYKPNVLDIETAPDGSVIAVGFASSDRNGNSHYASFEDFEHWLLYYRALIETHRITDDKEFNKRITKIYAHNGANFDYLSLLIYLQEADALVDCEYFMADSTGIGVKITIRGNIEITLLDSYRLMPASLAKLTHTFNVDDVKQEVPKECQNDYQLFKSKYPHLFWDYLRADCLGLQEVIYKFWQMMYDMFGSVGHLPMTLPSLALRVFTKFIDNGIMTPNNPKLKQLERDAYKGGLTLAIKTGTYDSITVYDVNSMYPSVMSSEKYPISYVGYWTRQFDPNVSALWRATFSQSELPYPPFLFDEKKGAQYNGNGAFSTEELLHLLSIGGQFTISEGYVYRRTENLFQKFVDTLYSRRKQATLEGDEALAFTLKIMLNSLYGKFAQREAGYKVVLGSGALMRELLAKGSKFFLLGDFLAIEEQREVRHTFVAVAAMITANARIRLHTLMKEHIDEYGVESVVYCDTDSIHVTSGSMPTSPELGAVKEEASGMIGAYAGKKIYTLSEPKQLYGETIAGKSVYVKTKGIGRRIIDGQLDHNTIARLSEDTEESEKLTFTGFPSVKEVLSGKKVAAKMRSITRTIKNTGSVR